jgi:hypothetical protein
LVHYINILFIIIIILVIAELVIYFTNNEIENTVRKSRSAEALYCLQSFKKKLFNQLLHMINSVYLYREESKPLFNKVSNFHN